MHFVYYSKKWNVGCLRLVEKLISYHSLIPNNVLPLQVNLCITLQVFYSNYILINLSAMK